MTEFASYTAPAFEESDQYRPADNYGHAVVVIVREHKLSIVTPNSPDGAPGVVVDVLDLDDGGNVYRNVLMMSGAIVDGFRTHAGTGRPLVVSWEKRTSKSGRTYPSPAAATAQQIDRAKEWYTKNGDPFAPKFDTADDSECPF